jgi:Clostripain family
MSSNAPKENKWTVMVYLAGDNNLTDECVHALTQMREVEGLEEQKICVLAQFDPKGGRLKTHRYKISAARKNPSMSADFQIWEKSKKTFPPEKYVEFEQFRRERRNEPPKKERETNTGSPITLFEFVSWCIEKHSAENYMLVLSGHGGGTEKGYLLRDEHPADALTTWEMQIALDEITKQHGVVIDILGMDACLMTMAEVSFQLREGAKLMVGSEGYSPIAGWPFKPVLTRMRDELARINESDWEKRTEMERIAVANGVVEEYVNYYLDYSIGGLSVEQSALDLRKADALKTAIDGLADALRAEFPADDKKANKEFNHALVLAHWKAQSYNGEEFVDLYDFCSLLREHYAKPSIVNACEAVLATEGSFVVRSCYSGPTYQYSRGVSIYFPWAEIDIDYKSVTFGFDNSKWRLFLEDYVVATRRDPRDIPRRKTGEKGLEDFGDNSQPYAMRHGPGRHGPGRGMLPEVSSMRNPPIAVGISQCVHQKEDQKKSFKGMEQAWQMAE